jgi:hypothetical protein
MPTRYYEIQVQIPPESRETIRKLSLLPDEFFPAIKRGMDRAIGVVRGDIQRERLSGVGPFPPGEHRLGERTGGMRDALINQPAVIQADAVTGSILWQHKYGIVHEEGRTIYGRPALRFQIDGKWIIASKVRIPARSPIRFGVTEKVDYIAGEIGSEIDKSFKDASE